MTRVTYSTALVLLFVVFASGERGRTTSATQVAAPGDSHAYFNTLVARSDHWKSYSLRDPRQLDYPKNGGYANGNSGPFWVTYNPATDSDPHAQDAAKVVIPAFVDLGAVLASNVNASTTTIPLNKVTGTYQRPRSIKIDNEIMTVAAYDTVAHTLTVTRGMFGTAAAPHTVNAGVGVGSNSLAKQVRLPLDTSDGHTYLFTWDAYWTDSYLGSGLSNHKTFQFSNGDDVLWLEVRTHYGGGQGGATAFRPPAFDTATDVAGVDIRNYNQFASTDPGWQPSWSVWTNTDGNQLGPGTTSRDALRPGTGNTFTVKPNTWTRFWVRIEQRANDYDYVDMWVADENTNPVQIYKRIPVSVRPPGVLKGNDTINKFWLEFNTSTAAFVRSHQRDLVTYVRNFVALRDTANPESVLLRPSAASGSAAQVGPAAPRNVRIAR